MGCLDEFLGFADSVQVGLTRLKLWTGNQVTRIRQEGKGDRFIGLDLSVFREGGEKL